MNTAENQAPFVVVGAGQAGCQVAQELRRLGYEGRILLYGEEPHAPYRRPPLSKAYLAGEVGEDALHLLRGNTAEHARIEFVGGVRVEAIDRRDKRLLLSDGREQAYARLALTTGGRARPLPLPGADRPNVFALRTIADVERIRPHFRAGRRLTIIGGGFIGLEVAAVARKQGLNVAVLEGLPRLLARVAGETVSEFYRREHLAAGVDLRTGVCVEGLEGDPEVTRVHLAGGETIATDFVIAGVGQSPNVDLAQQAGLPVEDGIVVDDCARTGDACIVAAGDCANFHSALYGRRLRLQSVQNAMEQARTAAAAMLDRAEPYTALPWFWSDQYDLKLQMAGLSAGYDQVVLRGEPAAREFAVFYLQAGRLIAADAVNRPQEFLFAKKLIAATAVPDVSRLADPGIPLKSFLAG